jgi:hypothetical protein
MSKSDNNLMDEIQFLTRGGIYSARTANILKKQQIKIEELEQQNKKLLESLNIVIEHLNFCPESSGFNSSKIDFETMKAWQATRDAGAGRQTALDAQAAHDDLDAQEARDLQDTLNAQAARQTALDAQEAKDLQYALDAQAARDE